MGSPLRPRRCYECGVTQPVEEFHLRPNGYRTSLCRTCNKILSKERYIRVGRDEWLALRAEVIQAYGGVCQCPHCPLRDRCDLAFLTIDHINGDGSERRRRGLEPRSKGYAFYRWLKENGYPKDNYQCLCWSCNCAKGQSGQCPHVTKYLAAQKNVLDSAQQQLFPV